MEELINKYTGRIEIVDKETDPNAHKYLKAAYSYTEKHSDDDSTWTGAVILDGDVIVAKGANVFSHGVKKTKERLIKPLKYTLLDHAERQAVYSAAKSGKKLEGLTIYTPWIPCSPCANAIISSGISTIVIHYEKTLKTPADWNLEVSHTFDILLEAGVTVKIFKGKIGGVNNLFRGEMWKP